MKKNLGGGEIWSKLGKFAFTGTDRASLVKKSFHSSFKSREKESSLA